MPKFPFSVLLTSKRKAETAPEEITAFLKVMKRSMDLIRTDKDRVLAAVLKKRTYEDSVIARKLIDQFPISIPLPLPRKTLMPGCALDEWK
jgi:hypothetical protein